jgi:hypothetical protein
MRMDRSERTSRMKSLAETASMLFSTNPSNPKSSQVLWRSILNPVEAKAAAPRGLWFTLAYASSILHRSL